MIMPTVNKERLTSSFAICIPFISFYHLIALATIFSMMLKELVRGDILFLYIILDGKFQVSHR